MRGPRGRPIGKGLAVFLAGIGFTGPLGAAPFVPDNDAVVLERLPTTLGGGSGEVRGLRDRLARAPTDLTLAVSVAGRYVELGQVQADPRYYGYAQAALSPWWGLADPPPEVLFLRAAIRQSRHEFDKALEDLAQLLKKDPRNPQAWLMQAVVLIVRADYQAALQACEGLARLRRGFLAFSCMGSVASLSGRAQGGYELLVLAKAQSQGATEPERIRLETLLGKTAERLRDWGRAEGHFQEAQRLGPHDAYLLGAYADFLLDQGRAGEVVALLRDETRVDGLLLRLTLAEREIGAPGKEAHIEELRARFAASRQRGDSLHQGEEARFLLHLVDQPQAALTLAQANWAVQREPRDVRILLEAALASAQPEAARPALEMLERTKLEDAALRRLANDLQAKDPPVPPLRKGGVGGVDEMMVFLALLIAWFWSAPAVAHKPSDSYLSFTVRDQVVSGQWDIALRDLDYAIGLDADGDGAITWGELKGRHDAIAAYALGHLRVSSGGQPCAAQAEEQLVDRHTDGSYAVLRFSARCAARGPRLVLHYDLFFDLDAQHRGLWRAEHEGHTQIGIFASDHREHTLALDAPSRLAEFLEYGREGVWHIWIGYDHILFLLSLLLPAVLWRSGGHWVPVSGFRPALTEVVKVVTAFTLAHSVTLSLAVLKVIALPARLVESAIAASVLLAALNNLYPLVTSRRWLVAFGFGLVHGLGFASVLLDLGLPTGSLALALVAFNLGVECGQLVIVGAFLPLAYGARRTKLYARMVFQGGSLAIMFVAALWLVQRSMDLKLP